MNLEVDGWQKSTVFHPQSKSQPLLYTVLPRRLTEGEVRPWVTTRVIGKGKISPSNFLRKIIGRRNEIVGYHRGSFLDHDLSISSYKS